MAKANQKQSNGSALNFDTQLGKVIDDAMGAIERENPTLKGVLPRDYARPSLDKFWFGGLVDIISNIGFNESAAKSKDVLGRVYEYFLGKFASAEGNGGGEFHTPQCVVQVIVSMLESYKGRVFDPCCGSGGMFVSSEKFVKKCVEVYANAFCPKMESV
jgi:type I restriction enzyme M protein